jgi:hypothetical protein
MLSVLEGAGYLIQRLESAKSCAENATKLNLLCSGVFNAAATEPVAAVCEATLDEVCALDRKLTIALGEYARATYHGSGPGPDDVESS